MSTKLQALIKKQQWRINDIEQQIDWLDQSVQSCQQEITTITNKLAPTAPTCQTINPEQEIIKMHWHNRLYGETRSLKEKKQQLLDQQQTLQNRLREEKIHRKCLQKQIERQQENRRFIAKRQQEKDLEALILIKDYS